MRDLLIYWKSFIVFLLPIICLPLPVLAKTPVSSFKLIYFLILEEITQFAIVDNKLLLLLYTIHNSIVICKELWLKA